MSQSQSRATPENMPPNKNNTSKFPNAFASGPYKTKTMKKMSCVTTPKYYICNIIVLVTNRVTSWCNCKNTDSDIAIGQSQERNEKDHPSLITVFCSEVECRNE